MTDSTHHQTPNVMTGIIYMLIAVFFFASMDAAIKWLSAFYSSYQVAFFRGLLSLPFIIGWIVIKAPKRALVTQLWHWHLARGVMSVLFLVGAVVGLRELSIANAYALFFSAPLLVAVLSIFILGEVIGVHRWAAIGIGFVGVLVALNPTGDGMLSFGAIACLLSVFGYAFTVIIIKKMSATETTHAMVLYFLLSVTIGCGLLSLLDWRVIQWEHWPYMIGLGATGALGQVFITEAFRYAPASVIAPLDYSALIWGTLYSYFVWHELASWHVWAGALIIIFSGLYLMYRESRIQQ